MRKLVLSLFSIIILAHLPIEVFSQDDNLSLSLSASKFYRSDNKRLFSEVHISSTGYGKTGEDNRSMNLGIMVKLTINKLIELESEKFSYYSELFFPIYNSRGKGGSSLEKTTLEYIPLTFSFIHQYFKKKEFSLFYKIGISWYHYKITDSKIIYDNLGTGLQPGYNKSISKNTPGITAGFGLSLKESRFISIVISAENRFVKDYNHNKYLNPYGTAFDGFILKAGLLFHMF